MQPPKPAPLLLSWPAWPTRHPQPRQQIGTPICAHIVDLLVSLCVLEHMRMLVRVRVCMCVCVCVCVCMCVCVCV